MALRDELLSGLANRQTVINFPNAEYANITSGFHDGSVSLDEKICDDDELDFNIIMSSLFSATIQGISDITGLKIYAYQTIGAYTVNLFTGYVQSAQYVSGTTHRKVLAYDVISYHANDNMSDWYNTVFASGDVTVKTFRDSLFAEIGITQVTATLVNDTVLLKKTLTSTTLPLIQLLGMICEFNGVIGHATRTGTFQYIDLSVSTNYDVSDNFRTTTTKEEYTTAKIGKVRIVTDTLTIEYGAGTNIYTIANNTLLNGLSNVALTAIATAMHNKVKDIEYRPCDIKMTISEPNLTVGDKITISTARESIVTYVMQNILSGVQMFTQEIIATGNQLRADSQTEGSNEISAIREEAKKYQWLIESGTNSTNFELTDRSATLVADYINLNGLVTFTGLDSSTANAIESVKTAEATDGLLTITDAVDSSLLVAEIEGLSTQATTPTPSAPITILNCEDGLLTVCGKNLFDGVLQNGTLDSNGNIAVSTTRTTSTNYTPVSSNSTIRIKNFDKTQTVWFIYCEYDINKVLTFRSTSTANGASRTIGATSKYIRFTLYDPTGTSVTDATQFQIEYNSVATLWEDYKGNSVDLTGINLRSNGSTTKDYIYFDSTDNLWKLQTVIGTKVFDGTEAITKNDGNAGDYLYYCDNTVIPKTQVVGLCSHLTHVSSTPTGTTIGCNLTNHATATYFNFGSAIMTTNTVVFLQSWLASQDTAGTPVTFNYVLATPTTTILSDALQTALNGLASYTGTTNITITADTTGVVEVNYATSFAGAVTLTNRASTNYSSANADSANALLYEWTATGTTEINGGKVKTDSITALQINVANLFAQDITFTGKITGGSGGLGGIIQSSNYVEDESGTKLDLTNGTFDTENFKIGADGSVNISGGSDLNLTAIDEEETRISVTSVSLGTTIKSEISPYRAYMSRYGLSSSAVTGCSFSYDGLNASYVNASGNLQDNLIAYSNSLEIRKFNSSQVIENWSKLTADIFALYDRYNDVSSEWFFIANRLISLYNFEHENTFLVDGTSGNTTIKGFLRLLDADDEIMVSLNPSTGSIISAGNIAIYNDNSFLARNTSGTHINMAKVSASNNALISSETGIGRTYIYGGTDAQTYITGQAYITGNCSALSFTDRTPFYDGNALEELKKVKGNKGEIEHASLPEFARAKVQKSKDPKTGVIEYEDGRNLGGLISVLTKAVQELTAINEEQNKRLEQLEKSRK